MARPRKSQSTPDAKQRIGEAFWNLLEENEIREITVGMITAKAQCNRGTFYYHYQDLEDLISTMLQEEMLEANVLAEGVFRMGTDEGFNVFEELSPAFVQRMNLIIERAGLELVFGKLHETAISFWNIVAAPDSRAIKPETEVLIDYYVGGILCMLAAHPAAIANTKLFGGTEDISPTLVTFVRKNCRFLLDEICEIQGLPIELVLTRLSAVNTYLKTMHS